MRKQSTIAVLLFAAVCMMVANPGMPSKKKKKTMADSTALAVGDSYGWIP